MELFDTHCHLNGFSREELLGVLERAREKGVTRLLCVGASEGFESARVATELAGEFEEIWASAGIHPHDAGKCSDVSLLRPYLEQEKVLAVGETGLDLYRDWAPVEAQYAVFRDTIRLAKEFSKPLIIHSRDAAEETIKVLEEEGASEVGGVFHCYAYDLEFARRLQSLNFIVSFTGNITFKKAQALREVVKGLSLGDFMLETDTPYMAPEPFRGKPSEPMHVRAIAELIAQLKAVEIEQVAKATTQTALQFFGISS